MNIYFLMLFMLFYDSSQKTKPQRIIKGFALETNYLFRCFYPTVCFCYVYSKLHRYM